MKARRVGKMFTLLALAGMAAACTRQDATQVGIKTTGWGKNVSVSTASGLKWLAPGTQYYFISTGEYALNVVARLPDSNDTETTISEDAVASYGVVKSSEGMPLQGAATVFVQFDNLENATPEVRDQVETLYRKIPPLEGENTDEYLNRIMTRLSQYALESIQNVYNDVPVQDVTKKTDEIQQRVIERVNGSFARQGLGFIKARSVVLAGINLGPAAEAANQQIGLATVQRTVANEQRAAAAELLAAQEELSDITAKIIEELKAAGATGENLDNLVCLHMKAHNQVFADRHPQGCFGISELSPIRP